MKRIIIGLMLLSSLASAKKVKFAVDMTGQEISLNGVHVAGDFQVIAGFSEDWSPTETPLTKEGSTDIYSTIVDLPAFSKYEYKFLNGDQFYEVEFVPEESRVGYDFNDSRWLYIDSIANDTTFIGAILFSKNAPAGKTLVKFIVDLKNEVSPGPLYVAGGFNDWKIRKNRLYSFVENIYETIVYTDSAYYHYKFYKGESPVAEVLSGDCVSSGNREINVKTSIVLPAVCFSSCNACGITGISENRALGKDVLYPNPASDKSILNLNDVSEVTLLDFTGRILRIYYTLGIQSLIIEKEDLASGLYTLNIAGKKNVSKRKLIFE